MGWLSFRTEPYTLKISVCFPVFKIYSLFRKLKLQMFCIVRESQEKSHGLPWKAVGPSSLSCVFIVFDVVLVVLSSAALFVFKHPWS